MHSVTSCGSFRPSTVLDDRAGRDSQRTSKRTAVANLDAFWRDAVREARRKQSRVRADFRRPRTVLLLTRLSSAMAIAKAFGARRRRLAMSRRSRRPSFPFRPRLLPDPACGLGMRKVSFISPKYLGPRSRARPKQRGLTIPDAPARSRSPRPAPPRTEQRPPRT